MENVDKYRLELNALHEAASPQAWAVCQGWHTHFGEPGWGSAQFVRSELSRAESAIRTLAGLSARPHEEDVCVGDRVVLLVDGYRGKFKGKTGVVTNVDGSTCGIRVPGEIAPGEMEEYVGPYLRNQFRVVK